MGIKKELKMGHKSVMNDITTTQYMSVCALHCTSIAVIHIECIKHVV